MQDQYGSTFREALKRSMAEPAKPYKSYNVREHPMVKSTTVILFTVMVLTVGVVSIYLFDRFESVLR